MAQQIPTDPLAAAYIAMQNPEFYRVVLKNWVTPWTNVDRSVHAPLNDYSATVIGLIRDDRPFTEVLTADVVYVGANGVVGSQYSHTDNQHYQDLEAQRHPSAPKSSGVARTEKVAAPSGNDPAEGLPRRETGISVGAGYLHPLEW